MVDTQNLFNSCTNDKKTFETLKKLYLYTWNNTYKSMEESYLKIQDGKIFINFDEIDDDYKYLGKFTTEEHAIFIYTESCNDKDQCLIILMHDKEFDVDYNLVGYFNIGIMLSYGRRSQFPEAKTVFIYENQINVKSNSDLNKIIKDQLKVTTINPNFLKEVSKKIGK